MTENRCLYRQWRTVSLTNDTVIGFARHLLLWHIIVDCVPFGIADETAPSSSRYRFFNLVPVYYSGAFALPAKGKICVT
jgi:hypothetical protein